VVFVADVSSVAYDALKMAVEHVLGKIREGKRLSTEDVLILYLGTIAGDLREIRAEIARLDGRIDETNKMIYDLAKRIDQTNQRIDGVVTSLSARMDETNKRIDELAKSLTAQISEVNKRIDDTNKRIDAVQTTLLGIQKLLMELVRTRQQ